MDVSQRILHQPRAYSAGNDLGTKNSATYEQTSLRSSLNIYSGDAPLARALIRAKLRTAHIARYHQHALQLRCAKRALTRHTERAALASHRRTFFRCLPQHRAAPLDALLADGSTSDISLVRAFGAGT